MQANTRRVPGEEGMWVLILGDMLVFSIFFLTFLYYRADAHSVFADGQNVLNQRFGLINTLLLLTSSLFVAMGVHRLRDTRKRAFPLFAGAIACGLGFVVIKGFEYSEKFASGITINTNDFFMLYFVLTGIHLMHVLVGLLILSFLAASSRDMEKASGRLMLIEGGALFWHLVDLLWIVLFALFYLVP
jgi:nitric oxide reductase NorE protein